MLSVENIPKEDCDLTKVKDFFKQFGDVQYVVYEKGDEKVVNVNFNFYLAWVGCILLKTVQLFTTRQFFFYLR